MHFPMAGFYTGKHQQEGLMAILQCKIAQFLEKWSLQRVILLDRQHCLPFEYWYVVTCER